MIRIIMEKAACPRCEGYERCTDGYVECELLALDGVPADFANALVHRVLGGDERAMDTLAALRTAARAGGSRNRRRGVVGMSKLPRLPEIISTDGSIDYTAVALHALKRLPRVVRDDLYGAGLWEDVLQTALMIAVTSARLGEDFKATYNRAQREYYLLLKAHGFARPKGSRGYVLREAAMETIR